MNLREASKIYGNIYTPNSRLMRSFLKVAVRCRPQTSNGAKQYFNVRSYSGGRHY